jgi:hypothetical protein
MNPYESPRCCDDLARDPSSGCVWRATIALGELTLLASVVIILAPAGLMCWTILGVIGWHDESWWLCAILGCITVVWIVVVSMVT